MLPRRPGEHGVHLRVGTVEDVAPDDRFDAVTLNNIIEHVPDPVATLRRSWELLAPGGCLVVLTPNAASLDHPNFGVRWRGLEPPRHLYLFSAASLAEVATRAGAEGAVVRATPRAVPFIWASSGNAPGSFAAIPLALVLEAMGERGEELVLVARRAS